MKSALKFSSKVWLTTIIIGPLILGIRIYFMYDWVYDPLAHAFLVPEMGIPVGILYFFPSWFISTIVCWYMFKKNVPNKLTKVYLSFVAIVLAVAPFAVMDYRSLFATNVDFLAGFPPDLFWTSTYIGLTVAGVWFYKLKPVNNPSGIIETSPK